MKPAQRAYVAAHAYVPEHLIAYVSAITGGRPHLIGDFLAYTCDDRLIFVGYPLSAPPGSVGAGRLCDGCSDFQSPDAAAAALLAALDAAIARFRPRLISITAPALPPGLGDCAVSPPDAYYRLDLAAVHPDKKLRNLLRRAGREVTVREGRFGPEHERLVADFLAAVPVDEGTRYIFERLGRYAGPKSRIISGIEALAGLVGHARNRLKQQTLPPGPPLLRGKGEDAALILEARDAAGRLVAFDIAAFGGEYAFYLFNFRAREGYVPGASDLLLARLIAEAEARGKRYLNLGLGINPGVSRFKEKWGATPFLAHVSCAWERPRGAWEEMLAGV